MNEIRIKIFEFLLLALILAAIVVLSVVEFERPVEPKVETIEIRHEKTPGHWRINPGRGPAHGRRR